MRNCKTLHLGHRFHLLQLKLLPEGNFSTLQFTPSFPGQHKETQDKTRVTQNATMKLNMLKETKECVSGTS